MLYPFPVTYGDIFTPHYSFAFSFIRKSVCVTKLIHVRLRVKEKEIGRGKQYNLTGSDPENPLTGTLCWSHNLAKEYMQQKAEAPLPQKNHPLERCHMLMKLGNEPPNEMGDFCEKERLVILVSFVCVK